MRQGRAKGNFPLRGPVSLICYLKSGILFQIRIAYDFLAAGDEIAQSLALEKTIGKKSQVSKLLEDFILGSELLDFRLVGSMSGFLGLTYSRLGILGRLLDQPLRLQPVASLQLSQPQESWQ